MVVDACIEYTDITWWTLALPDAATGKQLYRCMAKYLSSAEVLFVNATLLLLQLQDKEQERMQLLQMCHELMSKLEEAGLSL